MSNLKRRLLLMAAVFGGLLFGCTTGRSEELDVPPASTIGLTPVPIPTVTPAPASTPATPVACPPTPTLYHNDMLGVELAHPVELSVVEPQYLSDAYAISLINQDRSWLLQVGWLYQETRPLETVIEEYLSQLADLPVERAPVTLAGKEGVMLWPVPGEVTNTAIFLQVDSRPFRILYAREALDDAGRCLLAGLSFYPPTRTLADLALTPAADALYAPTPFTPPADWATYHNPTYGYSFRYPAERWTPVFPAHDEHLLSLTYEKDAIALRVKVARLGEDADLQLYGGAAGDFVPQGSVPFLGAEVERTARIYQDVVQAVHYNNTAAIQRGDLLFSLALVSNRDPYQGAIIPANVQAEANAILTTFVLDNGAASSTPTPESPSLASADVLLYRNGSLERVDVQGSNPLSLPSVTGIGDNPTDYFHANPPQISPDGRWLIAYAAASETTGNWRLFDATTGELVATGSGQARLSPTWSPDSIAFAFLDHSGICVYALEPASEACAPVVDFDGTVVENLIGAAYSPNGTHIALAQADMSAPCCRVMVWLFALDGSEAFAIGAYEMPPQATSTEMFEWTADGRLLIKTVEPDMNSILYSLTDLPTITYSRPVQDISPDGRWVLYRSGEVGDVNGSVIYDLPTNEACPRAILGSNNWAWSPDGTQLAFLLNCAAATESSWVYVLDAATGDVQWEKALPRPAEALYPLDRLFWSPDGTYLLLDGPDTTVEFTRPLSPIWRLAADGMGELEVLVESGYLVGVFQ